MPVSHLGLTVSHLPSATSFYLAALQPLGYRYIGRSGDSIGLGVQDADFFLTQKPKGASASPAHIAFSADSGLAVRNCYAAALNAGACPSGPPSYRNDERTAFNAAVEDLDGNVVEIVYREPDFYTQDDREAFAPPEDRRVLVWQNAVASSGAQDDLQSVSSRASRAKSRGQTVMDVASRASGSVRSQSAAPTPGLNRARTMPVSLASEFPTKAFLGTLLGAAAGAAIAYAMTKSEDDNARQEVTFAASTRGTSTKGAKSVTQRFLEEPTRPLKGSRSSLQESQQPGRESQWLLEAGPKSSNASSRADMPRHFSSVESRVSRATKGHRNFSVTESAYSRPNHSRGMRAIEPTSYDDDEVQDLISRVALSRRPAGPQRSKTIDVMECAPLSTVSRHSRHSSKRDRPDYYLEAPKPKSTTSRRSTRYSDYEDDQDLKRRDSGISMSSHRSRHAGDGSRYSSVSSAKPSRWGTSYYEPVEEAALPPVKATSSTAKSSHRGHSYYDSVVDIPLPASETAMSPTRRSRRGSSHHQSAAELRIPASQAAAPTEKSSRHGHSHYGHSHHDSAVEVSLPASIDPSDTINSSRYEASYRRSAAEVALPASVASSSTVKASRHQRAYQESAMEVPLPASIVSSSTAKPSRHESVRYEPSRRQSSRHRSPANYSLPASKASSTTTIPPSRHASSHYTSAAELPLPVSQNPSYVSAAHVPIPESHDGVDWAAEDSDGMGDTKTVVPDDSISCVGYTKARSSRSRHPSSSRHGRSEAGSERTVRAAKKEGSRHSAMTVPVRPKEEAYGRREGKRSTFSYA